MPPSRRRERHAGLARGAGEAVDERARARRQPPRRSRACDLAQGRQAAGGGDRIARQRAGLVDRAERRQLLHHVARAAEGRQRHAAADHLAEHVRSGVTPGMACAYRPCAPPRATRKPLMTSSKMSSAPCSRAQLAQRAHEVHGGAHEVHVAGDRLDDHAGDVGAVLRERLFELLRRCCSRAPACAAPSPRARRRWSGWPKVASARAGLDQQRVGVAVIAALELDDQLVAAGGAARQAQRAHRRFGARARPGAPARSTARA